jgi:Zn-dependent protease with chaperone function
MSVLARRSAIVLALLFGLVFAVGTGVLWYLQQPAWLAILFALGVVAAQFALGPWIIERLFTIRWVQPESLGAEFDQWYRQSCADRKIPVPRLGVIDDGNPNAFTYGHTPKDARVVVTSGLLEMLTPAETHAVVAHELGHVANRDFIVMTVASAVPMVLYVLYVWTRRIDARDSRGSLGPYAIAVAAGAYVAYLVSEYVVLLLSRVREYFADEASAVTTRDPNALSSALVKISYGLARRHDKAALAAEGEKKAKKGTQFEPARAVRALGIANIHAASGFAMSAADSAGEFSPALMAAAMQWDLKNPWAKWYEFNSTHPLTARRIQAMNQVARRMGIETPFGLTPGDGAPAAYTGNLPLELLVAALPYLGGVLGLAAGLMLTVASGSPALLGLPLIGAGAGWLVRTAYAYPRGESRLRTVASLVGEEINVSHIAPVRCAVEGEIIGRGVPGLFWSDDLVLRDGSGFLTLQYRQPLGFMEFLFGWLKAQKYLGRQARVHGWYRRSPVPYIEIDRVEMLDGRDGSVRCYFVWGCVALASLLVLAGIAVMLL